MVLIEDVSGQNIQSRLLVSIPTFGIADFMENMRKPENPSKHPKPVGDVFAGPG